MISQNVQLLENFIRAAINTKYPIDPPNEDEFMNEANNIRLMVSVTDEEFEQVIKKLKAALMITMDVGVFISDQNSDHQSWLPSRRADIEFYYWNRYKRFLEESKGWNTRVTSNLDTVSSEIVDLLGDPKSETYWQRRGLVLGDVQSGKTANYTAICNKAADTGYKVIIVLAGMMENLRMQTQERLDKEFAGRLSKDLFKLKKNKEVRNVFDGVGRIDKTKRISAFTSVLFDFNSTILNSNDLTLKNIKEPALFVVKKNKSVLKNLESWLTANNADSNGKIDLPLLLIDDEADNASVNTKKEDQDPTAINAAIRSILNRFYRASYVGITATPFANIFINPETASEMVGDDLFPRDFIYVLSPPSNYIGADGIFGDFPKYDKCLVQIDEEEITNFFPFKHKKDLEVDVLPSSLYEALGYFLLVNAIRDLRGDLTDHRSMLINVSRFTDVQVKIKELVIIWLSQVQSDVRNYSSLSEKRAMEINSIRFLKQLWDKYELEDKAGVPWLVMQQQYLHKAIAPIEARAVNQKTGAASLDYYTHREKGFRVIAIGGISLSRGLTLEGLAVSYFYRNSQMYDTLLQMGRWFGYRPNYDDLFKVWMAEDAIDWYGFITEAANELKNEISKMNKLNLTPKDFGLKVRQDPNSLIVTARNKMRTATPVSRPIQVTGKLLETPRLKSRKEVLDANERSFKLFVASLDSVGRRREIKESGLMWEGINKDLIVELLRSFDTHPWHLAFQSMALAEYIENNSTLNEWDVYLPGGSGTSYNLEGANGIIPINRQKRKITESDGMIKISGTKVRVGSGGISKIGLTRKQIESIEKAFRLANPTKRSVPDSAYLIKDRKPLLMLHVIEKKTEDDTNSNQRIPETLFALGIGLPGDGEVRTVDYVVNQVELRNWMDIDEEDEEDAFE
ncbi:endonuclease [Bacillus toyonensis]|uniref:Z1 domain-containing protein n=1 Tax=Bacillus toyonensis TaxID=155322 RepID=UPI000BF00AC8|nr:Z1 domain-containing protein [Bacillus toyonensis]PEM16138.1 endonuclease [Bacillus toyonensis]PGA48085.1 endonuclease [Bacillus toyonensis]PGB28365.1 endonuclease [Bacillus toyonensis]PGC33092.1 endonuclease [Bacillus toyonensis]PHF84550.1 endonuclease [Bacillus toyonensis]